MSRRLSYLLLWILLLASSRPASPQDTSSPAGIAPNPNTIVVTAGDLKTGLYGYDLFDVLAALRIKTGLTVKSSSDIGAEDWLLVRGLPRDSARVVLVLIDGMPLNDAYSNANEFEHLPPIELVEQIVVHKPPLPARFGGAHAAIEVLTKRDIKESHSEAAGAYGNYASKFGSAWTEGAPGRFSYFGMVDYLGTDNLTGIRRTPPRDHLVYGDRSYWIVKPVAKLGYKFSETSQLSFFGQYINSHKLYSNTAFRGDQEFRDRQLGSLNLNYRWNPIERFNLRAAAFRSDEGYRLNLIMHPDVRDQKRVVQGTRIDATATFPFKHTLTAGGDFTASHAEERVGTPLSVQDVGVYGLYVEDQWDPIESFTLRAGLRYDDHSEAEGAWNPSVMALYQPWKGLGLHGSWSRSTRWPALTEFAAADGALQGEQLNSWSTGLSYSLVPERLIAKASYFDLTLTSEAVISAHLHPGGMSFVYRNASDEVRSRGIEEEVTLLLPRGWSAFLNHTYNSVKREPGDTPVDFGGPRNLFNAGVTYAGSHVTSDLTLRYGGRAYGVQSDGGPRTQLEDWLAVDWAGSVNVVKGLSLFTRLSNLFDRTSETFDGRPMFGRTMVGGASYQF